jgi:LPS export ABC transporter protein LptC
MNRSGFFFLVFTILITLTITWLNSTWLSYKGFVLSSKDRLVDYYLSDFTLLNTYPDGKMRYLLKGTHLIHQQSTSASQIFSPIIQARDYDNGVISVSAKKALQDKKNGPIVLPGEVNIEKRSSKPIENFKLLTNDLTYNPVKKELSSNAKVALKSEFGNMQGVGFNTNLDEQELRIHNNVQAILIPEK